MGACATFFWRVRRATGAVVAALVEGLVEVVVEVVGGEAAVAGVVSVGLPVGLGPGARAGTPRWRYSLSGARPPGGPARAWCERARAGGAGCDVWGSRTRP